MNRRKAFTLVELLVVISIIALLVSILMPSLNKAKELAYRMKCSTNESAIGKAMGLYRGVNEDWLPLLFANSIDYELKNWGSISKTGVYTGFNREVKPVDTAEYCITAILYLLVRQGNNAKIFVCASDGDATPQPEAAVKYTDPVTNEEIYAWDFSEARNISYSYQSLRMGMWTQQHWPGQLILLADKTPVYSLGNQAYQVGWSDGISQADRRKNMSQNHSNGEEINALHVDGRVERATRADINDLVTPIDCIYTWFSSRDQARSSKQVDAALETGTSSNLMRQSVLDSFLHGPYRKP